MLAPAVMLFVALSPAADSSKDDLQKLQGAWVMVSGEMAGKPLNTEHVRASKITWEGSSVIVETPHQSSNQIRADITVDATQSPKHMDWVRSAGPGQGQQMLAIYEFTGPDEYRICFAPAGKPRPTEFRTHADDGRFLHVWHRAKP